MRRFFLILGIFLSLEPLTKETVIIPATTQTYGTAGDIVYSQMNLMDLLKNLSKTYNSLVDKAKVPEAVWQPQEDLPAEDKNFFVQDKTRVISGALDQAAEEIKDIPELVGLGLKVVSDPVGAKNELISFAQNMSWQKAKDFAKEAAKSTVQYDYLTNPKNEYKLYGTGRLGVSIVKLAATAGGAALKFVAMTKKAPDFLALWTRLTDKMDNLGWTQADKDRFRYDFETVDEGILKRFDDGEFDLDASKALDENKVLRRNADNLTALTNIKANLPTDGSMTMADVKAAIAKSDSKETFVTDLERELKNGEIDKAKKRLEKGVFYDSALPKPLPSNGIGSIINSSITNFVTLRKQARQAIADLTTTGDAYKTARQAKITEIGKFSEQIAEAIADAHFVQEGFSRVDDLLSDALPGAGKAGKFDRVFHNPQTGEWKIVECKGGTSEIGGRKRQLNNSMNEQGTKEYVQSIIEDLTKNGNSLSTRQRQLLSDLNDAILGNKAKSYILRQPFDDVTGNLKEARLSTIF
jgi:hypothetical protein